MTTNCCPNSTNNILYLKRITYDGDAFESYYIPAAEVGAALKKGAVPLLRIDGAAQNGPKIAIILGQEKHPERAEKDYSLHPDYADVILEAGGDPYFIFYDNIREQLENIRPDAIFLIGGVFNSPAAWYDTAVAEDVDKRGRAYLTLLDYAKEHKLPVLGICAGMQMLAGYFGAKMQKGINDGRSPEQSHKQNGEKIAHRVLIKDGTLLASIAGRGEIMTNSSHNEAVIAGSCGNSPITAQAEDGVVEAIEPANGWNRFLLGVQWHPERLVKHGDETAKAIFRAFVESAKHE